MKLNKLLKLGKKGGNNSKTPAAPFKEYEGLNIQARVDQLERIKAFNTATSNHCVGVSNRYYDVQAAVCHFIIEHLAAGLQMTSLAAHKQNPDYSSYLKIHYELLDRIGKEQRRFYYQMQDRVIVPLREWISGDYALIRGEVDKLYAYRNKLNNHKYHDMTVQHYVYRERIQIEHDKQLLVVMNHLANMDRVQHSHLQIVVDMIGILVEYGRAVEHILSPKDDNEASVFE